MLGKYCDWLITCQQSPVRVPHWHWRLAYLILGYRVQLRLQWEYYSPLHLHDRWLSRNLESSSHAYYVNALKSHRDVESLCQAHIIHVEIDLSRQWQWHLKFEF